MVWTGAAQLGAQLAGAAQAGAQAGAQVVPHEGLQHLPKRPCRPLKQLGLQQADVGQQLVAAGAAQAGAQAAGAAQAGAQPLLQLAAGAQQLAGALQLSQQGGLMSEQRR